MEGSKLSADAIYFDLSLLILNRCIQRQHRQKVADMFEDVFGRRNRLVVVEHVTHAHQLVGIEILLVTPPHLLSDTRHCR
jgi:hypothetical protein